MRYVCMVGGFIVALGLVGCGKQGANCSTPRDVDKTSTQYAYTYQVCVHPRGSMCHLLKHDDDNNTTQEVCTDLNGKRTERVVQTTELDD